ncbi:fumarylacetoacetate hydrolase family protein [Pseudoteredinibacter isoporae]|uniref:fumarylacetoacetate hydrolase family protein n=1 Tax=Pseudoteredinibacter isoporae TaxID=570281 RepID=UPI0031053BC4
MKANVQTFPETIGQVFALGLTYRAHIEEVGARETEPMMFAKHCEHTIGDCKLPLPREALLWQALENLDSEMALQFKGLLKVMPLMLDYEVELGLYLMEEVCAEQLADGQWMPKVGLFLANDVSARSLQICGELAASEAQKMDYWSLSKSLPGFLPVADAMYYPESILPDAFPDIELRLTVNGVEKQRDNCRNIIYSPKQVLHYALQASGERGLKSGDCILTGTPAGVALRMTPFKKLLANILPASWRVKLGIQSGAKDPSYLKAGDEIAIFAEPFGQQITQIID